jgi:tRNA dimethylallyltransferase
MSIINNSKKLVVVLGPTASGKSDLAVEIAKRYNGEVISADSRQIYEGMDIGSGKITKKEMQGVPHHLLDVASPRKRFTVAQFQKLAWKEIKKIQKRGKLPILCGGTGLYIQSIVDGLVIPEITPDAKLRAKMEKLSTEELFKKLKKLDPRRAENIDRHNRRRLIRALEIVIKTGQPVPTLETSAGSRTWQKLPRTDLGELNILQLGIAQPKEKLIKLINRRLYKRLKQGMVAEVKKLHHSGVSWKRLEEFGLEYRAIALYLQNKISKQQMIDRIQKESEQYAKRQMTWFQRDKKINWIKSYKETEKLVKNFLK